MSTLKPTFSQSIEEMIDLVPQNLPLYRDSGLWQIRTEDMADVIHQQEAHESLQDFLRKAVQKGVIHWDEGGYQKAITLLTDLNRRAEQLAAQLDELVVQKKKLEDEKSNVDAQIDYLTRSIETIQQLLPPLPYQEEDQLRRGIHLNAERIPSDQRIRRLAKAAHTVV